MAFALSNFGETWSINCTYWSVETQEFLVDLVESDYTKFESSRDYVATLIITTPWFGGVLYLFCVHRFAFKGFEAIFI